MFRVLAIVAAMKMGLGGAPQHGPGAGPPPGRGGPVGPMVPVPRGFPGPRPDMGSCRQGCQSSYNQCRIVTKGSPSCDGSFRGCLQGCFGPRR